MTVPVRVSSGLEKGSYSRVRQVNVLGLGSGFGIVLWLRLALKSMLDIVEMPLDQALRWLVLGLGLGLDLHFRVRVRVKGTDSSQN